MGTLYSIGPAVIEESRRQFMKIGTHDPVWKSTQLFPQLIKLGLFAYSAKDFLSNQTDQGSLAFVDKHVQPLNVGICRRAISPQCERPDIRIH